MKKLKVLLVVLMLFGAAGCSKEEVKPQREQTNQIVESRGVVDDFSDKLILNGKTISLPTTLEELGDDYEFDDAARFIDYTDDEGNECTIGIIKFRGENFATVNVLDVSKKELDKSSIITSFYTDTFTPEKDFVLGGMKKGSTRDDVINTLGAPEKEGKTGVMQYFNSKENSKCNRIVIQIDKTDNVKAITIDRYPNGWKGKE